MRSLSLEAHRQICCVPASRSKQKEFGIGNRIGAYLPNGDFVSSVALRRSYGISERADPAPISRVMPGEFLYGGLLLRHFGHFLLESLARVWALQRHADMPIVWHTEGDPSLTGWQASIFALLGIDTARFHFVVEPTQFELMHLPEVGYRIQDWAHPEHMSALACYAFLPPIAGLKLWLSRSALPEEAGNVQGVDVFESQLEEAGWRIVHPQQFDIQTQLAMMSDAEVIGGFAGSALHTLVLGKDVRARVVVVPRAENLNDNYVTIARTKALQQSVISAELTHLSGKGFKSQYALKDISGLLGALCNA